MAFFSRKINKNAQKKPLFVKDFAPASSGLTSINGTAFACIDRIASEFANLNYAIFDVKTKTKVRKHPIIPVLKEPNLEERHFNFFYQSAVDYFNGGCYWLKVMIGGEIVSLFRLNPSELKTNRKNGIKEYIYAGKVYTSDQVVYIPSRFDYSTIWGGKSIFTAVRSVFETANNLESFTQKSFLNGVVGKRLVIDVSKLLGDDVTEAQLRTLKDNFQNEYTGIQNAGRPILKRDGIEYSELDGTVTDNRAAELAENRKYQEHEIAKIFGIPKELLAGLSSGVNLENAFILFNEFAIRPMATQFQDAINSMLDEERFYFEFDYNGIMKVSLSARIDAEIKQINNGMLSLDEARALENRSPVEAGNTHFMPVNMMPWTEEIKKAYMAKQKNEANQVNDPTDENTQHIPQGDDKQ